MIYELKQHPQYFEDVLKGNKTFEVRKMDRDYRVGDLLALNEYDPYSGYTGRCCLVYVDYIMDEQEYCKERYAIMSIKPCAVHLFGTPYDHTSGVENYKVPLIEYDV